MLISSCVFSFHFGRREVARDFNTSPRETLFYLRSQSKHLPDEKMFLGRLPFRLIPLLGRDEGPAACRMTGRCQEGIRYTMRERFVII